MDINTLFGDLHENLIRLMDSEDSCHISSNSCEHRDAVLSVLADKATEEIVIFDKRFTHSWYDCESLLQRLEKAYGRGVKVTLYTPNILSPAIPLWMNVIETEDCMDVSFNFMVVDQKMFRLSTSHDKGIASFNAPENVKRMLETAERMKKVEKVVDFAYEWL